MSANETPQRRTAPEARAAVDTQASRTADAEAVDVEAADPQAVDVEAANNEAANNEAANNEPADVEAKSRIWAMMRDLVVEYGDHRRKVNEALGMSFVRSKALRRLAAGPMTMRELAVALGTDKAYITLTVDALEERGLVARTPHPGDRRYKLVTLTDEGRAAAALAEDILRRPPASLSVLVPDEIAELERMLAAVTAAAQSAEGADRAD
jgi:DNA-binding MarR family transcriptional regulator